MRTLVGAIHEKFDDTEVTAGDSFIQVFVPKSGPHTRSQDTGKLHLPARLTLDNLEISKAGDGEDISGQCGHVRELDLTKNTITDWKEVYKILDHIPCLHFLNLTKNPLSNETFGEGPHKSFPSVRDIALNGTGVSWPVIAKLLTSLPYLTELHVSLNKYKFVDLPESFVHNSLTKLFVNDCEIQDWSDISRLGKAFPGLQMLNIIETKIRTLSADSHFTEFPNLSALNISKCQIESWEEIDKFRQFPSLTNLRIMDIPLLEDWEEKQRRQHLIARLPNISQLNGGCVISEIERDVAERAFIRYFMDSQDKPARYLELEETHGKLDPLANIKFERLDYLNLLVKFEDKEDNMDVYLHQTVAEFKKMLRSFTGLPLEKMKVFYVEMFDGKIKDFCEMKLPSRTLLNYHMYAGDEIHIHRKD